MSGRRIGVYICECGGNISDHVDVARVKAAVAGEPGVVLASTAMFTCSDATQQEIIDDLAASRLDALVIASCSPKLHEGTFRLMAARGGLNPYQYVQVNIREQCSWAHMNDRRAATDKAIRAVRAGIAKAALTTALERLRIETVPHALVVGGGIAGLRAALSLAEMGIAVTLVEQSAELGGFAARRGPLFPHDRSGRELAAELMRRVRAAERITVLTDSALIARSGCVGRFQVRVRIGPAEASEFEVGAIIVATGFEPYRPSPGEFGHGLPGVLAMPEFLDLLDAAEERGELMLDGRPVRSVVFVYCVGSRQGPEVEGGHSTCSRICCSTAVHAGLRLAALPGRPAQYHLGQDVRTYGKDELLYDRACHAGALFLRTRLDDPPRVERDGERLVVRVRDRNTGPDEIEIPADLVVLATGMVPRANPELVGVLKLPIGREGFVNEVHPKLRPVETIMAGVLIAGACQGPRNLRESLQSALAAAAKTAALLKQGTLLLEPRVAVVNEAACVWCGACQAACPFDAVERREADGKAVAVVNQALCTGAGPCVAACERDAIDVQGFTSAQIEAQIEALAREVL